MRGRVRVLLTGLIVLVAVGMLGSCNFLFGILNNVTVDGERFDLDKLYLSNSEQVEAGMYVMVMILTSKDVNLDNESGFTGSGEALMLMVVSPSSDLADGKYMFPEGDPAEFAILMGMAIVGGVFNGWEEPAWDAAYSLASGALDVRGTVGGGYAMEFDLIGLDDLEAEVDIAGRYRGKVTGTFLIGDLFGGPAQVFGALR